MITALCGMDLGQEDSASLTLTRPKWGWGNKTRLAGPWGGLGACLFPVSEVRVCAARFRVIKVLSLVAWLCWLPQTAVSGKVNWTDGLSWVRLEN